MLGSRASSSTVRHSARMLWKGFLKKYSGLKQDFHHTTDFLHPALSVDTQLYLHPRHLTYDLQMLQRYIFSFPNFQLFPFLSIPPLCVCGKVVDM